MDGEMVSVGIASTRPVLLHAIRGVLASNGDVNVQFALYSSDGELPRVAGENIDVLICESVSIRSLKRVRAIFGAERHGRNLPVLMLGKPPGRRSFLSLVSSGVRGFVGGGPGDFAAMPEAIRVLASGGVYMPSRDTVDQHGLV